MSTKNQTGSSVKHKTWRIVGLVAGGLIMAYSLGFWFPFVGASLDQPDSSDSGPGVTNQQIIEFLFILWIIQWLVGLLIVLGSSAGWLRRTRWILLALTGAMLVAALVAWLIGSS